jgi:HAD superfamily hydrolase (TIGR01509 family)
MPPIRALIFDFDGLILDTETSCFGAWQALFAEHGQVYALEDYLLIVGTTNATRDPMLLLGERSGRTHDRDELRARLSALERARNGTLAPLPGVVAMLDQARALGLKLAVASSSSRGWVEGHLRTQGLFDRFDAVVNRSETLRPKPEPDIYLEALRQLDVRAYEALALEDSYNGSLAAKRAGLRCLAVPNNITRTQDFAHVDLRRDTLAGLDLAALLAELETE